MAQIVLGIGASHTPLLTLPVNEWRHRAAADYANPALNLSDGRVVSYPELLAEVGDAYADAVSEEVFDAKARQCHEALDRLADALEAAAPDVVLIVGDDQGELFQEGSQPAVSVYYGEELITLGSYGAEESPAWLQAAAPGYLMDRSHAVAGAPTLALELIAGLVERHVDVAITGKVQNPDEAAFGHAFGFIIKRLFKERSIPVLPILLNTYFPPNVPTPARCHDIGRAIRETLEASATDARVAVVASGGLSHFVVDEALDRRVIAGFDPCRTKLLRSLPREALQSGSSEILNWVMAAGIVETLPLAWCEYVPIQRTPAGTGIGAAFACWTEGRQADESAA